MALSSLDIQNKTFDTKFRGYDKVEIEEFLELITRDYDEFAQTIKNQERELKTLREQIKYYDDMRNTLNNSIVVAQDAADNLRTQAESESSKIIEDAGLKGQNIIEGAKKEGGLILTQASTDASRLIRDADDLRRKMRIYHQRMKQLIEAQLANVNSEDWTEVLDSGEIRLINPEEKLQEIVDNATTSASPIEHKAGMESQPTPPAPETPAQPEAPVAPEVPEAPAAPKPEGEEDQAHEASAQPAPTEGHEDLSNTMEFNK